MKQIMLFKALDISTDSITVEEIIYWVKNYYIAQPNHFLLLVIDQHTGCVKSNLEVLKFIKTISVCLII